MDELESRLGAILGNPEMMSKIMSLAQNLNTQESQKAPDPPKNDSPPEFDMNLLKKLSTFAGKSGADQNQQLLLKALRPYLSGTRLSKLERAMCAAKMAGMAGIFFGNPSSGR